MNDEKKQEQNDEEETYTTESTATKDMEARLADDYVPSTAVTEEVVNPNPYGDEEYVGTDPVYQNYADDAHKPLAAEGGPQQDAEEYAKSLHEDEDEVDDPGLGGTSTAADRGQGAGSVRYLVPGQEGYDRDKAEEQSGPAQRVVEEDEDEESEAQGAESSAATPSSKSAYTPTPVVNPEKK